MAQIKTLLIAPEDPRRRDSGCNQRTNRLWRQLLSEGEVTTVIPVLRTSEERHDGVDKIHWVAFEKRGGLKWCFNRVCHRMFRGMVFPNTGNFNARLKELNLTAFDRVVTRYLPVAGWTRAWEIAPLTIDADDYSPEVVGGGLRGWIVELWCQYVWNKAKEVWFANPCHVKVARKFNSKTYFKCVPNRPQEGIECKADVIGNRDVLFFVGLLSYRPNYEGLDKFLSSYWNQIKKEFPKMVLKIAGRDLPSSFASSWRQYQDIQLLGFVEDLTPLYQECIATIHPVYSGSGTSVKTLESMAFGRIPIGTPFAFRGGVVGDGCRIFRDGNELVAAIRWLRELSDAELRRHQMEAANAQRDNTLL